MATADARHQSLPWKMPDKQGGFGGGFWRLRRRTPRRRLPLLRQIPDTRMVGRSGMVGSRGMAGGDFRIAGDAL